MSTNAVIGILHENDTVSAVTLHWDGYPDHAGKILTEYYNTVEKATELISMGEISSIESSLDSCVFYNRDRGEELSDHHFATEAEFRKFWAIDYHYLFKDGSFV